MIAWLLHNALAATVLAAVVLPLTLLLRRRPALVHVLWLLVLVRLVVPPIGVPEPWIPMAAEPPVEAAAPAEVFQSGLQAERVAAPTGLAWLASEQARTTRQLLVGLWVLGSLVVLGRELRRVVLLRRLMASAAAADETLLARAASVAQRLDVPLPRVRALAGIASPFLWSLGRPCLIVPAEPAPTRAVLAHELAHLRRRDHWTARLEALLSVALWWHPLFHVVRRQMRLTMELACDAAVVEGYPEDRLDYARALVETAERAATRPRPGMALGILGGQVAAIESRLARIVDGDGPRRRWVRALPVLLVVPALVSWESVLPIDLPRPVDTAELGEVEREVLAGLDAESWEEAESDARAALAADPDDGAAWRKLSMVQLANADFRAALHSLSEQARCGHVPSIALYNTACAHTRLGEPTAAFATLEKVLAVGGLSPDALQHDPDFTDLREDPRFEDLLERTLAYWADRRAKEADEQAEGNEAP